MIALQSLLLLHRVQLLLQLVVQIGQSRVFLLRSAQQHFQILVAFLQRQNLRSCALRNVLASDFEFLLVFQFDLRVLLLNAFQSLLGIAEARFQNRNRASQRGKLVIALIDFALKLGKQRKLASLFRSISINSLKIDIQLFGLALCEFSHLFQLGTLLLVRYGAF